MTNHHHESLLELRQQTANDVPTAPAAQTHRHLPALDGVRGLAVLLVFLVHYGGGQKSQNPALHFAGVAIQAGWTGVTLFFILSGFLITGILWDARGTTSALKNFYLRRVLRIFPLYYACLVLALALAAVLGQAGTALAHVYVYALYLQNLPLSFGNGGIGSSLEFSHFWSLAVEEQFYLLWPFFILRLRTLRQARWLAVAVFIASAAFRIAAWYLLPSPEHPYGTPGYRVFHGAYGFTLSRAGELAAGAWLAMCYREPALWRKVVRAAPYTFVAGMLSFLLISWHAGTLTVECAANFMAGLPCVTAALSALLVLTLASRPVERCMSVRSLRWLGGISYGFYIFHVLFTRLFEQITARLVHHTEGPVAMGTNFCVALLLSLLFAYLSFRFFESPFLRLRSRFRQH